MRREVSGCGVVWIQLVPGDLLVRVMLLMLLPGWPHVIPSCVLAM